MKFYPVFEHPPNGVDACVMVLLKAFLPGPDACKEVFNHMVLSCKKKCLNEPEEHEVTLGLGEQKTLASFGKLFFVCKPSMRDPNYKMDTLMPSRLQLQPEEIAAFVGIVLRLDPQPLLGKDIRKENWDNWMSLVLSSLKRKINSEEVKEIQRSNCPWDIDDEDDVQTETPPSKLASCIASSSQSQRSSTKSTPTGRKGKGSTASPPWKSSPGPVSSSIKKNKAKVKARPAYARGRLFKDGRPGAKQQDSASESSSLPSSRTVKKGWHGKFAYRQSTPPVASQSSLLESPTAFSPVDMVTNPDASDRRCQSPEVIDISTTASEDDASYSELSSPGQCYKSKRGSEPDDEELTSSDANTVSTPTLGCKRCARRGKMAGASSKRVKVTPN